MERAHLIGHLDQLSNVERKTKVLFASIFRLHTLKNNQEFNGPVAPLRSICFNLDGLLHLFQKTVGHQQHKLTSLQFHVAGQLFSLSQNSSPNTKLVALRPSRILVSDVNNIKAIIKQDQAIVDLLDDIYRECQHQDYDRIALLSAATATARYQIASRQLGLALYHIPKYILANHLNISRKQLQRIIHQQLFTEKT